MRNHSTKSPPWPPPEADTHTLRPAASRDGPLSPHALLVAAGLLLATLLAHGWCLADGTVLDDYWHQKGLREHGWSLPELMRTLVIAPADFINLWWQTQDVRWEYARPLFILSMKVVYGLIGDNSATALHAYSLLLHYTSALLVAQLCWLMTRSRLWSLASGLLFVLYPHAGLTVAWSSSQNVVQQTTLLLAAMLTYVRASRLDLSPDAAPLRGDPPPPRRGALIATFLFWTAAILTRENALLAPAILMAMDYCFAGWRHLWARRRVYAGFAAIGAAFVAWRLTSVSTGMPEVYIRRPGDDLVEYALWCAAKLLHYVCTSIWLAPMTIGPTGRFNPWVEAPGDVALMILIVAALGALYYVLARPARGWWIWPLWILLAVLPVIPVIATPHSGYMSGVGFAIGLAVAAAAAGRPGRSRWLVHTARLTVAFYVVITGVFTLFNRWQWTGIIAAERYVPAWVRVSPPERSVRDVFFINLPFVNIYCKPQLVQKLGPWFEDVDVHALTFAPDAVLIEQTTYVEQLDPHRFRLRIAGQPYFSRLLGRFLIEGFRGGGRFHSGDEFDADGFRVRIVEADDEGVRCLEFSFDRPLADPSHCFYLVTPECGAARLRFHETIPPPVAAPRIELPAPPSRTEIELALSAVSAGSVEAAEVLFDTVLRGDQPAASSAGVAGPEYRTMGSAGVSPAARSELRPTVRSHSRGRDAESATDDTPHAANLNANVESAEEFLLRTSRLVAGAIGSPLQDLLARDTLSVEQWQQLRAWWRREMRPEYLREIVLHWERFDHLIKMREEVPHARMWASKLIETDLYLTGPPFPGPRDRPPSRKGGGL